MAQKTYEGKRDAKKLAKFARPGDMLYVVEDVSRRVAPYEDAQLASRYTVTHMHEIFGTAMCGSMSVEHLVNAMGPVYMEQPKGMRAIHEPTPQIAGPFSKKPFGRKLDEAEIIGLREESLTAEERRRKGKAGRSRWL